MGQDLSGHGNSKNSKASFSRRQVIVNAVTVATAGAVSEAAYALPTKKRGPLAVNPQILKAKFCAVVDAFNNGLADPSQFDPHVVMRSVKHSHVYRGWDPADANSYMNISVKDALRLLHYKDPMNPAKFIPLKGKVHYETTGLVHGHAYWHDNDGTPDDDFTFDFFFDSSYRVTEMLATQGTGYNGGAPVSDCT